MALTKGQPMAVQICSRQICHSLAAYLQLQVVWVYIIFAPKQVSYRLSLTSLNHHLAYFS
ncbi:hypothetical protein D2923_14180 [Vibrio cholerae]|nr:hypothetical protein D2B32_14000 [Vibrio cholerae]TLE17790.1 hypothetical protein D2923_14180 [Vibrio cholerae]